MQFIYNERPGPIRGVATGRETIPDIRIDFDPGDVITGALGGTSSYVFVSLGFWMLSGKQYGPYGGNSFTTPFTQASNIYGIYGCTYSNNGNLLSLGFWTDAPSPPPARPASPAASPPPPRAPGSSPLVNNGRTPSQYFGYNQGNPFDDGPFFTSELHPL